MSTYERMGAPPLPDDEPRGTAGLAEAEARLNNVADMCAIPSAKNLIVPNAKQHGEDIRLVLRELAGLKQFDPR